MVARSNSRLCLLQQLLTPELAQSQVLRFDLVSDREEPEEVACDGGSDGQEVHDD